MHTTVRRAFAVTAGAGALLVAAAGVANAADEANGGPANGGPADGPTPTHILNGVPAVPLPDSTLGVGALLRPVYDTLAGVTP